MISIHALREEGDEFTPCVTKSFTYFYPRPPRGGRPYAGCTSGLYLRISIHALREEGDPLGIGTISPIELISIHALREEGDRSRTSRSTSQKRFLSTPSARRATVCWLYIRFVSKNFYPRPPRGGRRGHPDPHHQQGNFYPRPPRGGRRSSVAVKFLDFVISIHALREEGDKLRFIVYCQSPLFLSTPSARRATF